MGQAGGDDAQWSLFSGTDKLHLGTTASGGAARTGTSGIGSLFDVRGQPPGGAAGIYGSWFENDRSRLGWYTDVRGQYGWGDDRLSLPGDRPHIGIASAEAGYAIRLGDSSPWVIQPQGQLIYLQNHNYNLTGSDFSTVDSAKRAGWVSRLGVRVQPDAIQMSGLHLRPYAAVNWWHDDLNDEAAMYQLPSVNPNNRYELKAGLNVDLRSGVAAWGDVGLQWGNQSYQAWTLRAGMKYAW
jgi:autotransporter family porin